MTDASHLSSSSSITAAGALAVLDRAVDRANEIGLACCLCICDPSGEPVLTLRMDGAPRLSAGIAANKAYTVAGFNGVPTDRWWSMIEDDPALANGITHTPRLVVFGGGVPVLVDGAMVGAVGVSGGSAEQDEDIASAGAAAMT